MRLPWITKQRIIVAASIVVGVLTTWSLILWYGGRIILRSEAVYNAEMRELNLDYEVRLRGEIDRLLRGRPGESDERESADQIFKMLRLSRVASQSREVNSSEVAPHTPGRTAVALKWAKVAANEAAYDAALHDRWGKDCDRGQLPHHITDDEVPPFRMPDGWTIDDLR